MASLTTRKLRIFNLVVGLFQLLAGGALIRITKYDNKLPVYTFFTFGQNRISADGFYAPQLKEIAKIPVGIYAAIFLLLSAANHLFTVLPVINTWYNRMLANNQNPFRWIEYSISASFMRVMIAQLAGVTDLHLLVAIFALTATTMTFGWLMELMNGKILTTYVVANTTEAPEKDVQTRGALQTDMRPKVSFAPFWLGFVPHMAAWAIVACYFFVAVKRGSPPTWVYAIIVIVFLLDLTFAINQFLQFKEVKFLQGFGRAEMFYIILSITSKQLLAWVNWGGVNRFSQ